MPRLRKAFAASLALLLTGCEAPEVRDTVAGLYAFRDSNRPNLEKAQSDLEGRIPDLPATPAPCSSRDYAQRRGRAFDHKLALLRSDWDTSETDNIRFFRMRATLRDGGPETLPPKNCPPSMGQSLLAALDRLERRQVDEADRGFVIPWGVSLGHPAPPDNVAPVNHRPTNP
jgi:hypothetical protein